jgi:nucleotide-binding universal stress UspA family protein
VTVITREQHRGTERDLLGRTRGRPVLLATLAARIDPAAERMAIETAQETDARLLIANVVRLPPYRSSIALLGPSGAVLPHEDDREEVRATADRAAEQRVQVELLRVFSPHPVRALAQVVDERDVGLLILGPDPSRVTPRLVRRAVRAVRHSDCLVWVAPDGYCR